MIKRLEDLEYYMNVVTGSIDTGEGWEADYATALREGDAEERGWGEDWRDSLVHVDEDGQEIEE